MPPVVEEEAAVIVIGERLGHSSGDGHYNQAVEPCGSLHPVVGMVDVSPSLKRFRSIHKSNKGT